jgi:hypothetical protein
MNLQDEVAIAVDRSRAAIEASSIRMAQSVRIREEFRRLIEESIDTIERSKQFIARADKLMSNK